MQVRNLMRSPVVSVGPDQSLQSAAQVMREHGIGSVVVEQDGQVVGILTERDVMHAAAEVGDVGQARVADHMTAPVVTASPTPTTGAAPAETTGQGGTSDQAQPQPPAGNEGAR